MKVLHKAKQLLQSFVATSDPYGFDNFKPKSFIRTPWFAFALGRKFWTNAPFLNILRRTESLNSPKKVFASTGLLAFLMVGVLSFGLFNSSESAGAVTLTYNTANTSSSFTVPSNVNSITISMRGGAGGQGGTDGYRGGIAGYHVGLISGTISVTPGTTISIYVGAGGSAGGGCVQNAGGGAGGQNPLSGYDGGTGGNAGPSGCSGGGGGGGAATVVDVGASRIVAGGGGGSGGGNNVRYDVYTDSRAPATFIAGTSGGTGQRPSGDGGGGGGGGGGASGGVGGSTCCLTSGETFGEGANAGSSTTASLAGLSASTATYSPSTSGEVVITYKSNQTITFGSLANRTMQGSNTFSISASASSGLTVAFTSATTPVCTVSGTTVTLVSAGTCSINANQSGNSDWNPATQVQQSFNVASALSVTTPSAGLAGVFGSPYTLTISRTGGATPHVFSIVSGSLPAGLTMSSSTGTISGTPTSVENQAVTIRVTDANGATASTSSFTISIAAAQLSTPSTPTSSATVGSLKSMGLLWDTVPNSNSYTVKIYATNGSTLLQTISNVSGTFITINSSNFAGIADGTNYKISVTAIGTGNYTSSGESSQASTTTNVKHTFDPNGGAGTVTEQIVAFGESTAVTANPFSRSGHTFRSWNTLANGTGTTFSDQQSTSITANRTLYAMWTSLEDRAWNKVSTSGNYASATTEVIPVATNAEWTVEAWVNPNASSAVSNSWHAILGQQNGGANRYSIWMYNNNLHLTTPSDNTPLAGGSESTVLSYVIQSSRWTHIAWVMSTGQNSKLYIDGQVVWEANLTRTTNAGSLFTVGGTDQADGEFPGHIDQVKVWGGQLTLEQINTSMHTHGTFSGAPTLRAHYDFNEFNTGALLDRSGNNRHLTLPAGTQSSEFTSSAIVETGAAHSLQTFVKFNRSYLTASGGWTPPAGVTAFKSLVVGGGGAGGSRHAGGGGAGALLWSDNTSISGATRIQVGQGALGITNITNHNGNLGGRSGQSSFLGTSELKGGGGGAGAQDTAKAGGSSGGLAGTGTAVAAGSGLGLKNAGGVGANNGVNYTGGGGGGALSAGATSTASAGGQGGSGFVSNITGQAACYAAGGGGGATSGATGAAGGACTSGQVSAIVSTSAGAGTNASYSGAIAGSGSVNSGSGGGAGGLNSTAGRSGGGGSGVVILSYGPGLEITRTTAVARAGSNFSEAIQVTAGDGSAEYDVTITATSQVLRVGTSGTAVTSVTVRTEDGVATFTDLGFISNVGVGARELTFTSDAFIGTSLTITPSQTASTINITSSGTTSGVFVNGNFESSTTGTANILNTDLQTHMQSFSTTVESSGTISVQASISSSEAGKGLTLKSVGRISVSAGSSALSPLLVGTAGGPITFWTTGATGGVALGNFTQLNTTQAGAAGADITIGGGVADSSDTNRPAGNALSSAGSSVVLGTSANASVVQLLSGSGDIVIRGEATAANAAHSGIDIQAGVRIVGYTVDIFGKNVATTSTNAESAGVYHYVNSASAKTLIEATVSSNVHRTAISITGQSKDASYGLMVSNITDSTVSDQITIRTTGASADIRLSGTTTRSTGAGVQAAGLVLSTFDGDVYIDTGAVDASLGRSTNGRQSAYSPNGGGVGGNITITAGSLDTTNHSIGAFNVTTQGTLTLVPPTGQSFTQAQTFPLAGSTTSVGNLIVGSSVNTADLTVGAAVTSASEVTYRGGSNTVSGNVTSTNGTVAFYSTGASKAFSKTSSTITAAQEVLISSAASSVDIGSGAISASSIRITPKTTYVGTASLSASSGSVSISGGSSVAVSGAISAQGTITLSGTGAITNPSSGTLTSSTGDVLVTSSAGAVTFTKAVSANNVRVDSFGAVTTGTETIKASQDIQFESSDSTITTGTGAISAGRDIYLVSSGNSTVGGATTATRFVSVTSGGTTDLNGNMTSGTQGILVKSSGRITTSAGANASSPRLFATTSGPITFWTTGTTGGVALGNFAQLDTTQSGTSGADITIGGGSAQTADTTRPSGPAKDSGDHGIALGTSAAASVVVMRAGTGNVSLSGEYTTQSASAYSGILLLPGNDIVGNQVQIRGVTGHNSDSGSTASGIFAFYASTVKTVIHSTGNFATPTAAVQLYSQSRSYWGSLIGPSVAATDAITLRASGDNGGVSVTGTSTRSTRAGLWLGSVTIETKNGPVFLESGADEAVLGRSSVGPVTYRPVSPGTGGDVTFKVYRNSETNDMSITTSGAVSYLPQDSSFTAAQTFPTAGSTINVGDLVVGSESNTADLTVGAPISSSGAVNYFGGDVLVDYGVLAGSDGILIKARRDIVVDTSSKSISTSSAGDIVFWANSQGTGGEVDTGGTSVSINSNGGDIVIGGGADDGANDGVALDGKPDNFLVGRTGNDIARLGANMNSGSGDITVRSQASAVATSNVNSAIYLEPSVRISSTTGRILLHGIQNSGNTSTSNTYGVILGYSSTLSQQAVINSTLGDVIIHGDASQRAASTNRRGVLLFGVRISAGGDIDIFGKSPPTSDSYDVIGWATSTVTATGDINLSGERISGLEFTTLNAEGTTTLSVGQLIGGELGGSTSSTTSVATAFAGSGAVVIEPFSTNFTAAQTLANVTIASSITGLTVGKSGNTASVTLPVAYSIAGDINVFSGAVAVNANQATTNSGNITVTASGDYTGSGTLTSAGDISITSASATVGAAMSANTDLTIVSTSLNVTRNLTSTLGSIFLKSEDNIVLQAGTNTSSKNTIQTSGADITLQSDSNGDSNGYVWIQNFTNITTGTGPGNILISGGSSPSTGFAAAASGDGQNRAGIQFGAIGAASSFTPGNADGITITSGTGNVTIRGKAIGNSQGRGILLPLSSTDANKSSITGKDITLVGHSEGATNTSWYGIEFGNSSSQTATSVKTLLNASGNLALSGTSSNFDGIVGNGNFELVGNRISLTGFGPRQPIRLGATTNNTGSLATSIAAGAGGFSYSGTKHLTGNTSEPLFKPASFTSTGTVSFEYDMGSSSGQLAIDAGLTVTNTDVTVRANDVFLGGSINAGTGAVKFEPFSSSRSISLGTNTTGELSLDATELGKITATTLRFETGSDTTVRSNLTFTNSVSELVIRAGGNVSAASNLSVVVARLGIEAGGNITWPGTGHNAAVIALNAGASGTISFGQSADYSVAAVDGIDPEFGLGVKFVLSNVDRTNTVDRFMAVTFNPPPAVVIKDKFDNALAPNNLSASGLVVRASMTATRTDSGTLSLVGETPTSQGGTSTFTSLRVDNGTGVVAIRFTVTSSTGTALVDADTNQTSTAINYTIRAGEPASIDLVFSATTTRAGLTGLSPTATLKDSTGGTLTSGDYKNANISVTITGTTGRIISGETSITTDGVARFPNLVVAGTAGTNAYTLTFSVSFRDSSNVTKTVSRSQLISITAGTPTTLSINSSSQTVTNRATLSDIAITALDDYGNAAAFGSPTSIAATVGAGTNLGLTPTLSGTATRSTDTNTSVATFSGLSLAGKVDTYTLTFASSGLTSTTHTVRVTHGAASNLVISAPTTAANDRNFASNVVVDIVDLDGNVVTTGDQSTQTITLDANTTLTGTREISATSGRATFTNLRMLGLVGTKVLEASIGVPSSISNTSNITLGFGDATRVALTRQASGFVNRVDFSTQPVIAVLDSSGNVVTNHSQSITVTRTSVDASKPATLTGTKTIFPNSGVVTFTNLRLEGKVGEFDLTFESGSLSSTTQRVTLTHGAVSAVVLTGASTASNARTFGSAIRVEIQDADANLITTGTAASQSIALTASGATLSGTTTRSSVAGAADFTDLILTGTTGAKTITATILDPSSRTGTRTVTVSHGAANQLTLTTSASQAVNRQTITTQPVIQVRDVSGNPVSDFVGRVSVAVSRAGTSVPFSLTGTRVIDLNGSPTATFSGLGLYGEVGDFTLTYTGLDTAANQSLTSATQSITLSHGTATSLLITSPSTARNSITLGSAITVEVRDQDNNRVTGNNSQVTLSISNATISGTAQRNASSGLATFGSLAVVGLEGAKTLTATLASPSLTQTAALTLEFGEATKLAISQAASGAVNRANFSVQPIIQAQDVSGNVVDDYTSSISIALSRSVSSVAFGLSGTGALNATSGVATFAGLGLFGATGDYTLTYSSGSLATTSQTLRLTHGVATQIKIIDGSTRVLNGAEFSRSIATQIQDQDGNVVTTGSDSTAIVTLTPSGATLNGTRSKAAGSGTASFTGLVMTGEAGSKSITASTATFTSAPYAVTLAAGAATKLVLTTPASGFVNRVAFSTQPSITVQDSSGNVVTSYADSITVTRTAVDAAKPATLTGTRTILPSSGVVTFTNLRLEGKVGEFDLTFESGSLSSTTQRVTLTHGAATAVVLTGATTASNARTIATNLVAEIQDADANRVTTGSDSSQQVVMTAIGAAISGTTSVNSSSGLATFSNLTLTGTVGAKTLTATILSPSSIAGTASTQLTHGEATQLAIVTAASNAVNRAAFSTQPVISVRDVSGNPVSDFVGRVSIAVSSSGSNTATLSGTTFRDLNGSPTATFTGVGLGGALGSYTLTYSSTGLTGATQSIDLAHGTATTLELIAPSTASNARTISSAVVVRLKDADGNLVTTGTPSVTLSISDATISGTAVRNLASGQVTFPGLKFVGLTGAKTLTASITSPVSLSATSPVQLSFGDATKLVVSTSATGAVNRETFTTQPAVTVQDVSGNPVTDFVGTISVSSSPSGAVLSGTTSRSLSGSAYASFNDLKLIGAIGNYSLTFAATDLTSATQAITVAHGAATTVELSVASSAVNNVGISDVVVRINDADGNLVTTGTPSVSLANSSPELTGTLVRNASSGVATFTGLKFLGSTGNKNVTANVASLSLSSITSVVSVSAGAATELVLSTSATGAVNRAGFATTPVVTIRDISGNSVVTSSATVSVSVTPVGSTTAALSGSTSRTPSQGVVSFAGLGLNGEVGQYTLTFASSGLASITQTVDLTHGAATKLSLGTSAASARAGIGFGTQPVIRILDQDNNLVTTGSSSSETVVASLTGLGSPAPVVLAGDVDIAASGGIATFTDLRLNGTVGTYTIRYQAGSLTTTDQNLQVVAGTVDRINIATGPSNIVAGAGFASAVEAQLVDAYDNVVLSDSTTDITATLVSSADVSSRSVSTTTVRVSNGVANFSALNYTLAGDHKISFSDGTRTAVSRSFTITHAVAGKLVWVTEPGAMRNDIVVGVAPSVRVLDQYNNPVLSGSSVSVTATVTGSNSGDISVISGNTATTSSGTELVSLPNLKLKGKASDYVIRMTGSVSGNSFSINSSPVALTFGLPSQLAITRDAAGARAGLAFDTQPRIAVRDNSNNLVADSTLRVTATVSGRTLVGTSAVTASGGVASFPDLGISGSAATGLVIRFATEYPAGTALEVTQSIDVTPGDAVKLAITQQPGNVLTRQQFANAVKVQLLDVYDNPVPGDSSTNVSIQLFKGLSPALATGGSQLTLTSQRASSGVATFTGLTLPVAPASDYFLKFTIGSFTVTSSQFEVLPGAVTSISITQEPSSNTGSGLMRTGDLLPTQPQVTLYDADGYVARGASGNVSVAISSGSGGSLSEGTVTAAVSNGVARFSGVRLVGTPSQLGAPAVDYRLQFSFTNEVNTRVSSGESAVLTVTNTSASKLVIARGAASGDAGRDFRTQPIIRIVDRYDNIVETGPDSGLLVIASAPGADSLNDNQINALSGVATFEDLALGGQVNTNYSLVFEVENRGDITSVTQSNVQIGFGLATKLRIVTQPQSLSGSDLTKTGASLATQPAVEVLDFYNNRVTNSSRQISVTLLREGATLDVKDRLVATVATPSSGVATFSGVAITGRPGDTYKLSFSATGLTGVTSAGLVVRHADPTVLEFVDQPVSLFSGSLTKTGSILAGQPKLRLLDFDGNVATEISSVSISASVVRGGGSTLTEVDSSNVPKNTASFQNGVATFTNLAVIATPGVEQALRFETSVRGRTLQSHESNGLTVTNGDPYQLAITTQPCAGAVVSTVCQAGITGDDLLVQPVVEVQDRFGNRAVNFSGTITVSTTNSRGQLSDRDLITVNEITATASAGVATFAQLNLVATPGDQIQLLFTSGSLNSVTSSAFTVRAAAASSIAVSTHPVGNRTGSNLAIDPVIELRDRFGNLAASDNVSRITVSSSGGILVGNTTATATAGRVTFSGLTFTGVPGLSYSLTFTGVNGSNASLTSISSNGFTVKNALANRAVITQQPTAAKTGDVLGETVVELRDFDNNLATDDSATVVRVEIVGGDNLARFVNSSDQTIVDSSTSTILRQTASGGVVRFSNLRLVGTPGVEYQLRFTANPDDLSADYTSNPSNALVLAHADPASLSVTTGPAANMTDTPLTTQPALRLLDRYGNLATSDNTTVVTASLFESTGGVIRSGGTATASGGVVTFSGLTVDGTPGALYKLRFTAGSITVDENVGFRLKKNASIALSYDAVSFSPSGTVSRSVVTDSPGTPVYSTTSSATICRVNSSTGVVTINGVGDCMVQVTIPDTTYYIGGSLNALLVINKAQQASIAISNATSVPYLQTLRLTASGGSGTGPLIYSTNGDCRVVGDVLITGDAGSFCRVRVEKEEDANYELRVSSWQVITVSRINQALLVIGNSTDVNVGDVNLFTHGGSGTGSVTYSIDPDTNGAQCSLISGTVLRAAADGTCDLTATKAASTNYNAAPSSMKRFTFSKAKQTVVFTSTIPAMPLAGGDLYEPLATASSGETVTYSITDGYGTYCEFDSVETSKVRFLAQGNCEITATQGGTAKYVAASAKQVIKVGLRNQTISFPAISDRRFGQPAFMLTATASSGLPVTYQLDRSVSQDACRVTSVGLVSIEKAGTCAIKASQPGNSQFQAAPDVTQMFTVTPDMAGAPHLVSVSASDETITATFTAPSYLGGSTITRYRMEVAMVGSSEVFVNFGCQANPLIPCQISGLPNGNGESYTVRIAAVTAAGIGSYSRTSDPVWTAVANDAVTDLVATSTSSNLNLSWDDPIAIGGTFESYEVYVWPLNVNSRPATPVTTIEDVNSSGTSIRLTNAQGGFLSLRSGSSGSVIKSSGYNIEVVTITDQKQSVMPENTANGKKLEATTPGSPASVQLTDLKDKVIVGWSAPTFDGGYSILGYVVKVNGQIACELETQGGQQVCTNSSQRVFEWSQLAVGSNYVFEIQAVNTLGLGTMSSTTHSIPAPVVTSGSGPTIPPALIPVKPVVPPKPGPAKPGLPPAPVTPVAPVSPVTPIPPSAAPADPSAPTAPTAPSDPGSTSSDGGASIGATGDDNAPPVPFDPLASPEATAALTDTLGNAAAAVGAIAAAAGAAAAAAGAAGAAAGGGSGGSGGSRAPAGGSTGGSGGSGEGGSIATIDTSHERYRNKRRGRGDRWKIWKKKWLTFADSPFIKMIVKTAKFSPLFSKIAVDGAYLRAAFGSFGLLPTVASALIALGAVAVNDTGVAAPHWQWFIVLAVIGIFDAFAGLIGTTLFVVGTIVMHGSLGLDDVRLLLGVIIVGYGPALLANAFRAFRKEPEDGEEYWWERLVDLVVLPFIGGWVTATMISTLPALAGSTLAVANHVDTFGITIAIAITLRVLLEEFVARWFPARLDTLHPTDVDDPAPIQKWISVAFRLSVFIFVTAALMGNVWQVWVGSALFILPTIIGFYSHKFRNYPWIWRVLPTGIPGLAFALIVASLTTSVVGMWFGTSPDLALWSFALLPIPMLALSIFGMLGREGNEGEIRWIRRPGFKWVYRIGGVVMLLATMQLAGVIQLI